MTISYSTNAVEKPIFEMPVPLEIKDLIDESLNAVLEETYAHRDIGPVGKCHDYAIVGARVLTLLLKHPYRPVSGGEILDCGDGIFTVVCPSRMARRQARHLSEIAHFHCWIQADHVVDGRLRLEIVDFTARHDEEFARALNIDFTRAITENYLWDWSETINERVPTPLRTHPAMRSLKKELMWVDRNCTRLLRNIERERDTYFSGLTSRVLNRLLDRLEQRCSDSQS